MNKIIKEAYGDNLFCQEIDDEMHRLDLVSQAYDFMTRRQLASVMYKSDLQCLDIGSGNGSVALWLTQQDRVSEVTALDRFTHALKVRLNGLEKLRIIESDLNDDNFSGQFDIINVRFVLMHLRNRDQILKKITSWLKPGGWLVVSDIIDLSPNRLDDELYRNIMSVMWNVLIETIGTDKNWSLSLSEHYRSLELQNIKQEIYLPPVNEGAPMAEFWALTWRAMHDRLISFGKIEESTLTEVEKKLLRGEILALSPGMMTCTGQKGFPCDKHEITGDF